MLSSQPIQGGLPIHTLLCTYPRLIHAELVTHRSKSRNAGSSRAIPTKRLMAAVTEAPMPFVFIGANQKGMRAAEEIPPGTQVQFEKEWQELKRINMTYAERWSTIYDIHKQTANRVLEPFQYITVLITATEWENFFDLRDHRDAQPEFGELAKKIKVVVRTAPRIPLLPGEWHTPFIQEEEKELPLQKRLLVSSARCARTSYLSNATMKPSLWEEDFELARKLFSKPFHASPFEHCATHRSNSPQKYRRMRVFNDLSGNFDRNYVQLRKVLEKNESFLF